MRAGLFLLVALCAFASPAWATNFALLLGGSSSDEDGSTAVDVSKNIREIAIDELNIDCREMTTGLDVEYRRMQQAGWRLYGPGQAHWGNAHITAALGGSKELQAWFQEAAKGKGIRKNISVTLFKSNKTAGRGYNLYDCFPVKWSTPDLDASTGARTETFTVKIGRIEFTTSVAPGDPPATGGVLVSDPNGRPVERFDSWGGGEPGVLLTPLLSDAKLRTSSPGHKTVNEITLRGAMTDGRQNLCGWLNDAVNGKFTRQTLAIREMLSVDGSVKDGKQYVYYGCFPTRYVFPRMSVTNTTGNTMEEVTVKPIRLELK